MSDGLLSDQRQERSQDSVGHPPDDVGCLGRPEQVGVNDPSTSMDLDFSALGGSSEGVDGGPQMQRNLLIGNDFGAGRKPENERSHYHLGEEGIARLKVVQLAHKGAGPEVDPGLLENLPRDGVQQVPVGSVPPPARKTHLSRPGVTLLDGPPYQKQLRTAGGGLDEDDCHRSLPGLRVVSTPGLASFEACSNVRKRDLRHRGLPG